MTQWIKWWKNKAFLQIWGLMLLAMGISLVLVLINPNSWVCIGGVFVVCIGIGVGIRKIAEKELDKKAEEMNNDTKEY